MLKSELNGFVIGKRVAANEQTDIPVRDVLLISEKFLPIPLGYQALRRVPGLLKNLMNVEESFLWKHSRKFPWSHLK